ncbi:MAG: hypothetical protein KA758_08235 [Acidimicrobiales bacterium]|nr:hypothetical protein [Acidimicrobiales bacterium]
MPGYAHACSTPLTTTTTRAISTGGGDKCLGEKASSQAPCVASAPISFTIGSGISVSQIFSGLVNLAQGQIDLTYTGLTAGETCTTTLDGNCGGATTTVTHPTTTGSVIAITCTAANPTTITYSCTVC